MSKVYNSYRAARSQFSIDEIPLPDSGGVSVHMKTADYSISRPGYPLLRSLLNSLVCLQVERVCCPLTSQCQCELF